MRRYETIFILRSDLGEAQLKETIKRFESIVAAGGGELIETDEWGSRELAYKIGRERRGYYVRLDYAAPGPVMNEVERNLKLADNVLRYLSVMVAPEVDAAKLRGEVESRRQRAEARAASAAAPAQTAQGPSAEAATPASPEQSPGTEAAPVVQPEQGPIAEAATPVTPASPEQSPGTEATPVAQPEQSPIAEAAAGAEAEQGAVEASEAVSEGAEPATEDKGPDSGRQSN